MRTLLRLLLFLLLFPVLAYAGLAVWAYTGPRSLDRLNPYLEKLLQKELGARRVSIRHTTLSWENWDDLLDFKVEQVRLYGDDGALVLTLPEISLGYDFRTVLQGSYFPSVLTLYRPHLTLKRTADGDIRFGLDTGSDTAGDTNAPLETEVVALHSEAEENAEGNAYALPTTLKGLAAYWFSENPENPAMLAHMRQIIVKSARFSVSDAHSGTHWSLSDVYLVLTRDTHTLRGTVMVNPDAKNASKDTGAEEQGRFLLLTGRYVPASQQLAVASRFQGVYPPELAPLFPHVEILKGLDTRASGQASLVLANDFTPLSARLDIRTGKGRLADIPYFSETLALKDMRAQLHYQNAPNRVHIEDLRLRFDGPAFTAKGKLSFDETHGEWGGEGRIGVADMPVDSLGDYWPRDVVPFTRKWITTNIRRGVVSKAEADLVIAPEVLSGSKPMPRDALKATVKVKGARLRYAPDMPEVHGINATLALDARSLSAQFHSARMFKETVGKKGRFTIPDWRPDVPKATLRVDVVAPAAEVADMLARPDIDLAEYLHLDKRTARGKVAGTVAMDMHLMAEDGTPESRPQYDIAARLTQVDLPDFLELTDLRNIDADLNVSNKALGVKGTFTVAGEPASVDWKGTFRREKGGQTGTHQAALDLPDSVLKEFEFPERVATVKGRIRAKLDVNDAPDGTRYRVQADLREAAWEMPLIQHTKAAGEPGAAGMAFSFAPDRSVRMEALAIKSESLHIKGSGTLAPGWNAPFRFAFSTMRTPRHDLQAEVIQHAPRHWRVGLAGKRFDAAWYREQVASKASSPGAGQPDAYDWKQAQLHLDVEKVWLGGKIPLHQVKGQLTCIEQCTGKLKAATADKQPVYFTLTDARRGGYTLRELMISADNAGAFLKTLNITDRMKSGELFLDGRFEDSKPGSPFLGRIKIKDFTLIKAPVLARILSIALLTGILDSLNGDGIAFEKLTGDLHYHKGSITLQRGRAYGFSLGISAEGEIALNTAVTLSLKGAISPAYTFNSLVGNIPIIGAAIAGGEGEGLFAARYTAKGTYPNVEVEVNPLSVITPGFLRGIFDTVGE